MRPARLRIQRHTQTMRSILRRERKVHRAELDVTGLALVSTPGGKVVIAANSGDSLKVFTIKRR